MSTPDPGHISVRFEAQVPAGFAGPEDHHAEKQKRFEAQLLTSIPQPGNEHLVRVLTGTALGAICAEVTYGSSLPVEVRALVYPVLHYPTSAPPSLPSTAVPGTSMSGGTRWVWNGTNEVPGADHCPAPGALNVLAFWRKNGSWSFDGSVIFKGVTGTSGPCGSGSGSVAGNMEFHRELAANPTLLVTVPDGPNAGTYKAAAVSPLTWLVTIGGECYAILGDAARAALSLCGPSSSASSTAIAFGPFSATFPGGIFEAKCDVVVTKA